MAKLPIYNSQGNITSEAPKAIMPVQQDNSMAEALINTGNALGELAEQWQNSKDQVETLDAKNKMFEQSTRILSEAQSFAGNNKQDLDAKKSELSNQLMSMSNDLSIGFSSQRAAKNFLMTSQLSTRENIIKLDAIFRNKYIDKAKSEIIVSQKNNMETYISTGNAAYKQSYANDLENMFKSGFISEEYKTKELQKLDEWDKYYVLRQAESNPDQVISNLKSGKYNIKPEYYHDLLKDLKDIKTNKQLLADYEQNVKQNNNEDKATQYIYGNTSYDDKLKYINEQEFLGNISEKFAQQARRNIKQFMPANRRTMSYANSIQNVMEQAYDLNSADISSEEYLTGVRNLRNQINYMQSTGEISTEDAIKLNNQLSTATNKKVSEATADIGDGYGAAKTYIDNALPPQLRAEAVREVFYSTSGKVNENMSAAQTKQIYYNAAQQAVQKVKSNNRQKALQTSRASRVGDVWQGHKITSNYGYRKAPNSEASTDHKGIDLAYNNNERINAFASGKVVKVVNDQSKSTKGYGNYVDIQSYDGTIHRYAHANKITVKVGQYINSGDAIAKAGSTGNSTGTHLHYEKIVKGKSVNPLGNQRIANNSNRKGSWAF